MWQTSSLKGHDAEERLRAVGAEAMALAAFAALVPENILRLTPGGILNVHPSLLPRWRGAAPIQSALLAGDTETGVSIIRLVQALDAGPILLQERLPIAPRTTICRWSHGWRRSVRELLVRALAEPPEPRRRTTRSPRTANASTATTRASTGPSQQKPIWHQVRAYRAWPQAFTTFDGR